MSMRNLSENPEISRGAMHSSGLSGLIGCMRSRSGDSESTILSRSEARDASGALALLLANGAIELSMDHHAVSGSKVITLCRYVDLDRGIPVITVTLGSHDQPLASSA